MIHCLREFEKKKHSDYYDIDASKFRNIYIYIYIDGISENLKER